MSEAIVVNLFFILRVFVVGGLLLILPRITRKGLLFGVYVGEEYGEGDEGRRLLRSWGLGCGLLMTVSLAVGLTISAAGRPVAGNLTGTAVLLLLALALYVRMYTRTRALVPAVASRQAERAAAPLEVGEPKGAVFAKFSLGVCLVTGLATAAYAILGYEAMPARVPALSGAFGAANGLSDKSIVSVMFVPSLSFVIGPLFAVLALLTAGAKLSVREGSDGRSVEAQEAFRATNARCLAGLAVLFCGWLSFLSVQLIRFQLAEITSLGLTGMLAFPITLVLFMGGCLIRIMKRYGQGGARIEGSSVGRPLAGGLADNTNWVLGVFYVDRSDPSMMVEKRFGIGYALNYGNRNAVLLMVIFLGLMLSLAALALIGFVV